MNYIDNARQALKQIKLQGIEISISDNAKVDSRNDCGYSVEVIIRPITAVKQSQTIKFVKEALRKTKFPKDNDGYDEVSVSMDTKPTNRKSQEKRGFNIHSMP